MRTATLLFLLFGVCQGSVAQVAIPALTGRIMDGANVLAPETERTLDSFLSIHEDSTSNQILVVTLPSLEGESIEEFGLRAGREWGIGTDENDNGVLLVVAPNDREVRIEVGYGLEGALPDAIASRIIRNEILPDFRDGDFDGGVTAGVHAIAAAVEGEYAGSESSEGPPEWVVRVIISSVFFVLATIGAFGALLANGAARWIIFVFLTPFFGAAGFLATLSIFGALGMLIVYALMFVYFSRLPVVMKVRNKVAEAAKKGENAVVTLGGFRFTVGSSSSGGGGGSGRGFSGGGGSFGGGGASGSW